MLTTSPLSILAAFILYRQHHQAAVVAQNPGLANPDISKIIGEQWRALSEDAKNEWRALAEVCACELSREILETNPLNRKRKQDINNSILIIDINLDGTVEVDTALVAAVVIVPLLF